MADYSSEFSNRLSPGERLVWTGAPARGVMLTGRDVFLIPFGLFWCAFVIFWEGTALFAARASQLWFFPIFGLPFVAMGIFLIAGRFFLDAWFWEGTRYAITDKRVFILKKRPSLDLTTINLDRLENIRFKERGDGRGTISFGRPLGLFGFGYSGFAMYLPSIDPTPQFLNIEGARDVFERIERASGRLSS